MTIAILGHGNVGGAIARALAAKGKRVILAIDPNRSEALPEWIATSDCEVMPAASACSQAEALVLAVPYGAIESAVTPLRQALRGKALVDCTNPVGPGLSHGLNSVTSGSERLQSLLPESRVVKCFSIYGFENLESPPASRPRPAMLLCGDDSSAKHMASEMASDIGWEPVDVGPLSQALHLEHMTLLWIGMVRENGAPVRTVWARVVG